MNQLKYRNRIKTAIILVCKVGSDKNLKFDGGAVVKENMTRLLTQIFTGKKPYKVWWPIAIKIN